MKTHLLRSWARRFVLHPRTSDITADAFAKNDGRGGSVLAQAIAQCLTSIVVMFALTAAPVSVWAKNKVVSPAKEDAAALATFDTGPEPTWVMPSESPSLRDLPSAPMQFALVDRQTKLEAGTSTHFFRAVRVLNEASALGPGAQLQVVFDPIYQQLTLHRIDIVRGGRRIDKLNRAKVQLLHRETQLERREYDGRVTASIVLDDVRVGDRIEWSYSLRGENPVFEGKFVETDWSVADNGPIALYRYRLLAPSNRHIHYRVGSDVYKVSDKVRGDTREILVTRSAVPQFQYDPYTPPSTYLPDQVQFSEFEDWADVARWADKLFSSADEIKPEVASRARAITASATQAEDKVRRVLDMVQQEVRYFGTEMGENSHLPQPPDKVLRQRFGDCKDKTTLLVAMLRHLGIEATPVLVSTAFRNKIDTMLPSPIVFDHAIARVTLGDKTLFLDGTREYQTGALAGRQPVGLGKGLAARDGDIALLSLPSASEELRVEEVDTINVDKLSETPTMEARITYFGDLAEGIRAALATRPLSQFERDMAGDFARLYPSIRQDGGLRKLDDPERNALTLVMRFTIPDYWRFPEERVLVGNYALTALISPLRLPTQAPRTQPMMFFFPGIYRQTIDYQFGEDIYDAPASAHADDQTAAFTLHVQRDMSRKHIQVQGELRLTAEALAAEDWTTYRDQLDKVFVHLANAVAVPSLTPAQIQQYTQDYKALVDGVRASRIKVATSVQLTSRARLMVLTAQLANGRLGPKLRAQALVARGVQLDQLYRVQEAKADFTEAIKLDPKNADAHSAMAVNALLRQQDDEVDQEVAQAQALAPADVAARYTRVYANFFRHNYAKARDELQDILRSRSEVERSYGALWLYLTVRHGGADGTQTIKAYAPAGARPAWPYPVLQLFSGSSDLDHALAEARDNGRADPSKLCELYYYVGEKYLLDGNEAQAREYFQKSIDTGVVEFVEYALARRELQRIAAH